MLDVGRMNYATALKILYATVCWNQRLIARHSNRTVATTCGDASTARDANLYAEIVIAAIIQGPRCIVVINFCGPSLTSDLIGTTRRVQQQYLLRQLYHAISASMHNVIRGSEEIAK